MTVHAVRMCSCGHEESFHVDGGRCTYGRGHVAGGCTCASFSRRRRSAVAAPPTDEKSAPSSTLLEAIDDTIRALTRLRAELAPAAPSTRVIRRRPVETSAPVQRPRADNDSRLGRCERAILTVLAQHGTRTKVQVAILAGYSHTSGGFRNSLSALRTSGLLIVTGDQLFITEAGRAALGAVEPLPTGRALLEYWKANAGGRCERRILEELADVYPRALPKPALANRTGYQATSGGFRNSLSRLRTLQLIKGSAELALVPTLAEAS